MWRNTYYIYYFQRPIYSAISYPWVIVNKRRFIMYNIIMYKTLYIYNYNICLGVTYIIYNYVWLLSITKQLF